MIQRVVVRNFKMFREESFDLSDSVILAGPNNRGKTSLLQAIAVWNLGLQKWLAERGPESKSKAKKRTGVAITRQDFSAIPLREMNLLWTDRSAALSKDDVSGDQKPGTPRLLSISLHGNGPAQTWELTIEFTYRYPDLVHVRPAEDTPVDAILEKARDILVVHVPPFSGIGPEETGLDRAYQDRLIGHGKPGDILRNLLLEVFTREENWKAICRDVEEIFQYRLLPPQYEGRPFILCEYQPGIPERLGHKTLPKLDISCAGSGFLQVLMLLGFFYARPASILLLDEPDAHLHVKLQKQVYDRLRQVARNRGCQLLIATHSEVLIDNTAPEKIIDFHRRPHRLVIDLERDQIREALKRLTSLDILQAEQAKGVLFLESETDLNLLREWARVFGHPAYEVLAKNPFWHNNKGRNPREARGHFFALKAVNPEIQAVLILDGDNRSLPDHEVSAEGLSVLRWRRYEAENYLVHPDALSRFAGGTSTDLFSMVSVERGITYLKNQLPPAVYSNPLAEHPYWERTPASKELLPGFFRASGIELTKNEYYQVAAQMLPGELSSEIKEKLDGLYQVLRSEQ